MTEGIECPLPWCAGERDEHGDEGDSPDRWLHSSEPAPLGGHGFGRITSEGAGPAEYYVHLAIDGPHDDEQLRALAIELHAIASQLDFIAQRMPGS